VRHGAARAGALYLDPLDDGGLDRLHRIHKTRIDHPVYTHDRKIPAGVRGVNPNLIAYNGTTMQEYILQFTHTQSKDTGGGQRLTPS